MTSHDAFEATIASWFDAEAQAPVPEGALADALVATVGRRPRPSRLATLGSHRIADATSTSTSFGGRRIEMPTLRSSPAILFLLLLAVLLLAAAAILVGSRADRAPADLWAARLRAERRHLPG